MLVDDFARARHREKRGGDPLLVSLSGAADVASEDCADFVALDDALQTLEKLAPRQARVVEMRFFAGLSLEETAEVLEVSLSTVRRDWSLAGAWLFRELNRKEFPLTPEHYQRVGDLITLRWSCAELARLPRLAAVTMKAPRGPVSLEAHQQADSFIAGKMAESFEDGRPAAIESCSSDAA